MSKKPASVFERISKLLHPSDRGHKLQRHVDLAYQFALVAPLGGGAMVALQALHLRDIGRTSMPSHWSLHPHNSTVAWVTALAAVTRSQRRTRSSGVGHSL
jgi:hypothetical protein